MGSLQSSFFDPPMLEEQIVDQGGKFVMQNKFKESKGGSTFKVMK